MAKHPEQDKYSDQEATRRFEAALRGAKSVGHKPQYEMKIGKKRKPNKKASRKPPKLAQP